VDIPATIKRINAGDRHAFASLVRHFQRPLFGFLGRMGCSQAQAEELAQETFLRAWKNLASYKPETAEFSTWLFTIARNLTLHEFERAANRHEFTVEDDLPEQACERHQPYDALASVQEKQRLQQALHKLPLSDRSVLALAYIHELELAAVARIEACSIGAIKTRLHRAREKLRRLLENDDG
jgi:RNA polymerase sigma-70 factor (ECF subfamily)